MSSRHSLYMAYYARMPSPRLLSHYHAALVVLPDLAVHVRHQKAHDGYNKAQTPSNSLLHRFTSALSRKHSIPTEKSECTDQNCIGTKLDVFNIPARDESGNGRVTWEFRIEKADVHVKGTKLRMRLVALMYVGQVMALEGLGDQDSVEKIVRDVPVPKYADQQPEWNCTRWVFDSLNLLENAGAIPALPSTPVPELWKIGIQFADEWRTDESFQIAGSSKNVPCCDVEGKETSTPLVEAYDL
ncbi:hypothetical protein AX15_000498 [Amanita polypyramis BW_CC]|nr:hypothetical protein AX15_000498 [Amanita polypyramis BW_CC]